MKKEDIERLIAVMLLAFFMSSSSLMQASEAATDTAPKYNTMICDFSIKDNSGADATLLYEGTQYTMAAYIYKESAAGCSDSLKEPISGEYMAFLKDGVTGLGISTTSSSGYAARYFTPGVLDAGTHNITAVHRGAFYYDRGYYGSSSKQIIVNVVSIAGAPAASPADTKTGTGATVPTPPAANNHPAAPGNAPAQSTPPQGAQGDIFARSGIASWTTIIILLILAGSIGYIYGRAGKKK